MKNDSSSTSILTSNVSNSPKSNHFPKSFSIPHFWGDVVDSVLKKSCHTKETVDIIIMHINENICTQSMTYISSV